MRSLTLAVLPLVLTGALLTGCTGGGGDDGLKPSVKNGMSDLNDLAKQSDGKWSALKPEEQKKFLDMYGTEEESKKMLGLMAHPPNAKPPAKGR